MNPPNGRIDPSSAASGSFVGFPSLSNAQPSGKSSPFLLDSMILPRAVTDVAMSTVMYVSDGIPKATGLVPINASLPPKGAIAGSVFAKTRPMQFSLNAKSE